jgi:hypothetical protein
MCYSSHRSVAQVRSAARRYDEPPPWSRTPDQPHARIGDAERDESMSLLGDAAAEGYLTPDELDERLGVALTARTVQDLRSLTHDLPPEWQARRARRAFAAEAQRRARTAVRSHIATYVRVMAILVAAWLTAGVLAGAWYPWPVWPALFWGIALLAQIRAVGRPATTQQPEKPRVKIGM